MLTPDGVAECRPQQDMTETVQLIKMMRTAALHIMGCAWKYQP